MKIDHGKFIDLYKAQYGALNDSQSSGMDKLLGFLEQDKDVSDVRWAAYMLATVKEECADTSQPIEERDKGQGYPYGNPVPVTGSDGKTYVNAYYGRGYPQLTGADLYRKMGEDLNLGDQLLIHPERALDPTISYNALSFNMRKGAFTGVGLDHQWLTVRLHQRTQDRQRPRRGKPDRRLCERARMSAETELQRRSARPSPISHRQCLGWGERAKGAWLEFPRCARRRQQQPDRYRLPGAWGSRQWQQHLGQAGGRRLCHRRLLRHPQLQRLQPAATGLPRRDATLTGSAATRTSPAGTEYLPAPHCQCPGRGECAKGARHRLSGCTSHSERQPDRHHLPGARRGRQRQQQLERAGGRKLCYRFLLRHRQLQRLQSADPRVQGCPS